MLRLSVGIEDPADVIGDLRQAIDAATDAAERATGAGASASVSADGSENATRDAPDRTTE
jgi:hypothetical protein